MTVGQSFEEYWPTWPKGEEGTALVQIQTQCSFKQLVAHLWGSGSKFQVNNMVSVEHHVGPITIKLTYKIRYVLRTGSLYGGDGRISS